MGKINLGVSDNDISSFAELRDEIRKLHPKGEEKENIGLPLNGEPLEKYLAANNPKTNFNRIDKFDEIIPDNTEQRRMDNYMHKLKDAAPIDLTKKPDKKLYETGIDMIGIGEMPAKDVPAVEHKLHVNSALNL
jgi:hypothetical protein